MERYVQGMFAHHHHFKNINPKITQEVRKRGLVKSATVQLLERHQASTLMDSKVATD